MKNSRIWEVIYVTVSVLILFFLLLGSVNNESPTYDEVTYVEAGYRFLVDKDFRFDPFNPPLAKEIIALPALIQKNVIYDRVIFWPRMMTVLFAIALAILVYVFSKRLFGGLAAKLALCLFIFEPDILAHGHYATADMIFTFFLLLSIFLFWMWRKNMTGRKLVVSAIVIGLLLSTKLTSIPFLIFPLLVLFILEKRNKVDLIKLSYWRKNFWFVLIFTLITAFTLWSTYFFKLEPLLGYRFDKNRPAIELAKNNPIVKFALTYPVPLGSYISTIKQIALFNYSNLYVKRSFIMGIISVSGSPGYYFPVVFIIKTPLPLLILLFLSLIILIKYKGKNMYILVPLFFILVNVLFSKVALVNRYILPVYPLVIVYSSQIVNMKKLIRKKYLYTFLGILLVWYIVGTIQTYPNFISYMNEIVGDKNNRYKYLVDSNYDWGQGLIALENYQKNNHLDNLQFAYFGSINPSDYGIKYEKIKNLSINDNKSMVKLKFDKNHTIAISATCWYFCGYDKNLEFNDRNPVDIIGGSILIFKK